MSNNDTWVEDEKEIIKEFQEFYKKLFETNGSRDWGQVFKYVPTIVSDEMNRSLTDELKEEEIKEAVFQMGCFKSPGPDGFNGYFFQNYWSIVGEDVCKMVKSFFHSGRMLKELNQREIVLIPK